MPNRWVRRLAAIGLGLCLAACGDQVPSTPGWERVGLHGGVTVSPAEIMAEIGCVPQVGAPDSGTVAIQTPTRHLLRFACGAVHPDSITRALASVHWLLSSGVIPPSAQEGPGGEGMERLAPGGMLLERVVGGGLGANPKR